MEVNGVILCNVRAMGEFGWHRNLKDLMPGCPPLTRIRDIYIVRINLKLASPTHMRSTERPNSQSRVSYRIWRLND